MKIVTRGVYCTDEIEADFEKIASRLKHISQWFYINAMEGEEIDQDIWEEHIEELTDISSTQSEVSNMFDQLGKSMVLEIKKQRGSN